MQLCRSSLVVNEVFHEICTLLKKYEEVLSKIETEFKYRYLV